MAMSEWRPHWKDESMSEYSERCCYCGDFYLAYGVVRAVMNGTAKRICNTVIDGDADAYLAVLDIRAALDGGDA